MNRITTWILLTVGRRKWGVTAVIMPYIVERFGPLGALRWMARNIPPYERALEELGPIRGNLVFTTASLLNGCAYCTYAHGRAFELYYFEKYGKLFPLDDHELLALIPLTDDEVRERLEKALVDAGLQSEVDVFRRFYALKLEGGSPQNREEEHLAHAIAMYDDLNYCAIASQSGLDEAHDRVNKDEALKRRYADARLAASRPELTR